MNKKRIVVFAITILVMLSCVAGYSKSAINNMNLGLDLKGGFEILYDVKPLDSAENKKIDMSAVAEAIDKHINVLGVSEPEISIEDQRIRVQLAGIKDIESAREVISSTAVLSFRDTSDQLLMDATVLKEGGASLGYQDGKPIVQLAIADTKKFAEVTKALSQTEDKLMVTWLDYKEGDHYKTESTKENPAFISAATVNEELNSKSVYISGNFSEEDAKQLADLLNSGSLNFQMKEVYSYVVSPNLGEGSFDVTIFAGMIGILGIIIFMVFVYRFPGIISAVTIAAYTIVTLLIYTMMGGVFTLSGIAGLVLGVGMAVDSSVITFERIKDCLYQGRSVRQAYKEGTSKSFSTIFDSQLTTFISALILYTFGTGTVKGFATMLLVSTIVTILFNVTIVRFLLGQIVQSGFLDNKKKWFGIKESLIPDLSKGEKKKEFGIFSKFDFIKNAKYFIICSITIVVIAIGVMGFNAVNAKSAVNLGIDFSGGTRITLTSDTSFNTNTLKKEVEALGVKVDSIHLSGDKNTIATIAIKDAINEKQRSEINDYATKTYGFEASDSTVSPIIGKDLVKKAILMSLLSWVGILIYVSIRFKWDYAISGIVALIHDVLIILAVFAIFRMEITTDIIAVLLAIIGYSINDSIVAFDRIRENCVDYESRFKSITNEQYREIVNTSMQETIVRSIITTVTTLIPVLCLIFLGSASVLTFNIALLVGLIAGANSSIFIAAQLWYVLRCKFKPKHKAKKSHHRKKDELEEYVIPGIND
ncbi:MAG: protein translocase subunit SecD [Erysipelotrichia bacterium]|nr:protein translocase subunit SecD [Erysipelotrichia bacterium]